MSEFSVYQGPVSTTALMTLCSKHRLAISHGLKPTILGTLGSWNSRHGLRDLFCHDRPETLIGAPSSSGCTCCLLLPLTHVGIPSGRKAKYRGKSTDLGKAFTRGGV